MWQDTRAGRLGDGSMPDSYNLRDWRHWSGPSASTNWPASKTIRLRKTNRCGVVPARNQRSNVARCSSVSGNTATRFMGGKVPNLPPTYK